MTTDVYHAVGKRKRAIAQVWVRPADGNTRTVNGKTLQEYFSRDSLVAAVEEPLTVTSTLDRVSVIARTHGGGIAGQAGALRLGIARALEKMDETLRGQLRTAGLLTRDARSKERKKYGMAGARKRYQFSKR
ncbi:MAG: 30S ribosomal protein S9 [Candidatus Latescibacteria bacterium]|nr:30S ribosomal protein S9 [Candidatus Latescibacterota bacterium]